jgi:AraC-like DNA-binding protein
MAAGIIHDPALARALARLAGLRSSLTRVERWRARDCPDVGDQVHAIPTLVICLAGALRVEGGPRGRTDLRPGEALVIPPTARHRHCPLRGASQGLDLGFVADLTDFDVVGDGARAWGRAPREPYRTLVERLARSPSAAERVELARRLCGDLAEERLASMRYPHPALSRMLAVLWRFAPGTTAADLLRASRLGASQAHARFRAFFGESPKQAILTLRLGMARHLLDEGAGVAEAAERSGFPRRADLTRAWRIRFGGPPSRRR